MLPHPPGTTREVATTRETVRSIDPCCLRSYATLQSMDDEWWDLVDETGNPTGRRWRRGDPGWPHGALHLTVGVCAFRADGRILLTQRAPTKSHPLEWEFPAGSVHAGEASADAARRELAEETGLATNSSDLHHVTRLVEPDALLDIYLAGPITDTVLNFDEEEVATGQWLTIGEAFDRFSDAGTANPWKYRLPDYWHGITEGIRSTLDHAS